MKKYLLYLVAISFAALFLISIKSAKAVSARGQRPQFVSGQLLVKYKSEVEEPDIERDIVDRVPPSSRAGIRPLHTNALGKFYVVKLQEGVSVEDAASTLSRSPNVEYAEPNYYVRPMETTPNDPFFPQEWGMLNTGIQPGGKAGADIDAPRAWDLTTGGDVAPVHGVHSFGRYYQSGCGRVRPTSTFISSL